MTISEIEEMHEMVLENFLRLREGEKNLYCYCDNVPVYITFKDGEYCVTYGNSNFYAKKISRAIEFITNCGFIKGSEWIKYGYRLYICKFCGRQAPTDPDGEQELTDYCPSCGRRMFK